MEEFFDWSMPPKKIETPRQNPSTPLQTPANPLTSLNPSPPLQTPINPPTSPNSNKQIKGEDAKNLVGLFNHHGGANSIFFKDSNTNQIMTSLNKSEKQIQAFFKNITTKVKKKGCTQEGSKLKTEIVDNELIDPGEDISEDEFELTSLEREISLFLSISGKLSSEEITPFP